MPSVISIQKHELACFFVAHDLCDCTHRCDSWICVLSELHANVLDGGAAQLEPLVALK